MNCLFAEYDERDADNCCRMICTRCGRITKSRTPHPPERVHFHGCTGLPHLHELKNWLEFFAEAYGLDRAAAICRYVRWRFRGSKLEELPPGVPRPNVPQPLSEAELCELRQTDPTLAGNRLEAMFKAMGIPACGGCQARRDWLNKCHAWLRDVTSPK